MIPTLTVRYWRTARRSALLWAADAASWPLALGGGWAEAEAFAHALPESFPLLRGQVVTALIHAPADIGAAGTVQPESAEEDAAQRQKSQRLPEGDLAPAEERRHQPIPQVQHYFAADGDEEQHRQNRQRGNENQSLPSLGHVPSL